ncbi:MAG TPA: wax ester/triacylglycerol synthase family O-acyltransferase [Mycobacteriales bacterium]|nr:wax ester/triacylglycerol synthase family O-acyltransferase [Mycobacteriales bacterium]
MAEQLTGMDAAFLALETAELPMHVLGVLLLDPSPGDGYSRARLRQVVADRIHLMPPFGRQLVTVPLSLDKPYWLEVADVDLSLHLFDDEVDPPGDARALGDLVGRIASRRLDRDRPLWELHVVHGLAAGRVGLVAKVHHCTLYGAAGAEFIAALLDLEPNPPPLPAPPLPGPQDERPGAFALTGRTLANQLRWPLAAGRAVLSSGRGLISALPAVGRMIAGSGPATMPIASPRTPISGPPTRARIAAFSALPLEQAKQVKDAAGVKLNDVVLATIALALRRYLRARDAVPGRPLVVSCPLNAGEGETSGTNRLAALLVALPMRESEPAELLQLVHRNSAMAKEITGAAGTSTLASLADVTPPAAVSVVTWLMRSLGLSALQPALQNLIVSNVMGPPVALYLAGARIDAIYPLGPLLPGTGMNITVLSNLDRLDVGIMACPDLVADTWAIADALPGCLEELAAAFS